MRAGARRAGRRSAAERRAADSSPRSHTGGRYDSTRARRRRRPAPRLSHEGAQALAGAAALANSVDKVAAEAETYDSLSKQADE